MKREVLALACAVGLAAVAPAQQVRSFVSPPLNPGVGQPPINRPPAVSPYLNLARGGLPGINYYGLVRPEVEFRQSILGLRQDLQQATLVPQLGVQPQQQLLSTGHGAVFFNLGHYYPVGGFPPRTGR
jgi:hypothetical protein